MKSKTITESEPVSQNDYFIFNDSVAYFDPLSIFIYEEIGKGSSLHQILNLPSSSFPKKVKPEEITIRHCFRKCLFIKNYLQKKTENCERFSPIYPHEIEFNIANLTQITFETTDSCNLNCRYCGYGDFYYNHDKRENRKLEIESAKTLLDYLIDLWNSNLNISHNRNIYVSFYGGEPLLNMDFIKEIVNYVNFKSLIHNHVTFSLTTNALLLKKNIKYFVTHNFKLLISLDGNKENNSYRLFHDGTESFDIVCENLTFVKSSYPEYFDKMISFNSVLHNKNSVSEIYNFIKNRFGKVPAISEVNTTGIRTDKKKDFFQLYQNKKESMHKAKDYNQIQKRMFYKDDKTIDIGVFLHQYSGNIFHDYNDFYINRDSIKRTPTGTCYPFGKKMFVTVNGKILACERIGHQFSIGKVSCDKVELNFEDIATMYNNYYAKISDQCNHCYNLENCKQCIFNIEGIEENPICKGFINAQQFSRQINLKMSILEKDPILYEKIIKRLIIEM